MAESTSHLGLYLPANQEQGWGEHVNENFQEIDTSIYLLQQTSNPAAYVPAGGLIMNLSPTVPEGWLLCDGRLVNKADYPALWGAIGETYGASTSSQFKLPNLQMRFPVGAASATGYALGNTGGAETVTLSEDQMPEHKHDVSMASAGTHTHTYQEGQQSSRSTYSGNPATWTYLFQNSLTITSEAGGHAHTLTESKKGGSAAHENRPPYFAVWFIVKS